MKRIIIVTALLAVMTVGVCTASADTLARDAMVAYSGTDAFTHLIPEERQACVNWLVTGGQMNELCSSAVMKLITEAPDAVTPKQRQALLMEASGITQTQTVQASAPPPPPQPEPQTIKQDDSSGKIVAAGLLGIVAGMIIHNNVGGSSHKSNPPAPSAPVVHHPAPQRHAPVPHNPPQVHRQQPQRPVNAPKPPRR